MQLTSKHQYSEEISYIVDRMSFAASLIDAAANIMVSIRIKTKDNEYQK